MRDMFAGERRLHGQLLRAIDTGMTLARRDAIGEAFSSDESLAWVKNTLSDDR